MNEVHQIAALESVPIPAELGEVQELYQAGTANVSAGFVIASALALGGLFGVVWCLGKIIEAGGKAPIMGNDGPSWSSALLCLAVSVALIAGGLGVAWYANSLRHRRVYLCQEGLFVIKAQQGQPIPWNQIGEIVEIATQDHFPLHGIARHALPVKTSRTYTLIRVDGWKTTLDGDAVKKIAEIGQILEERARDHAIPWKIVRL